MNVPLGHLSYQGCTEELFPGVSVLNLDFKMWKNLDSLIFSLQACLVGLLSLKHRPTYKAICCLDGGFQMAFNQTGLTPYPLKTKLVFSNPNHT